MRTSTRLLAAVAGAVLLQACGSDGGTEPTPVTVTGVFLDAAVEGLEYRSGTQTTATTNAAGQFNCQSGQTVSFTVGGLALGSAGCGATLTPLSLASGQRVQDDPVSNRALALQLLDEDGDPANGIRITAAVRSTLASRTMDFSATASAFNAAMTATLALLPEPYRSRTVDGERRMLAREHFEDTLASRTAAPAPETVTQSSAAGTVSATITRYQIQAADSFYVPYEGNNAATRAEFPKGFLPSYGSGLAFKGKRADGTLEFYGITDRGPNGDGPKVPAIAPATGTSDAKYFPAPSFAPAIGLITVGSDGAVLRSSTPLRFSSTAKATGMSLAPGKIGSSGEVPLMNESRYDPAKADFNDTGLDTEAVVVDAARNALWVSDEYGPFILKVDPATGTILKKYQPGPGAADLPAVLAKRRANRGMEGLTLDVASGKLHGFLQSPLDDGKASFVKPGAAAASNENVRDFAKF
ncbi:MAG TPA: esterase-like activity of phytase family protein, partial [Ramlibacter sp.]|nr:esterase-like activity of phytase family protein [Ramlibacter sp.]